MKDTKKLAIAALLAALSVAVMSVGMAVEALDLSACMLASLIAVIVYIEIGSPHVWLLWLVVSLVSWIVFPGSVLWVEYLFVFGPYPILKGYIERLPQRAWIPLKLLFVTLSASLLLLIVEVVIGLPFVGEVGDVMKTVYLVLALVIFFAYDKLITLFARLYIAKYRKRFARFFK